MRPPFGAPVHAWGSSLSQSVSRARRSSAVILGITGVVAASLTGCSSDEPVRYQGVCVDRTTMQRLDDDQCDDDDASRGYYGGHGWYYYGVGRSAPAVGQPASGGFWAAPKDGSYVSGGVPKSGGTVSSSSAKSSGGKVTTVRSGGFGGGYKGSGG